MTSASSPSDHGGQAPRLDDGAADDWYRPTAHEVATNWPTGVDPLADPWRSQESPLQALEAIMLPALAEGPSFVSFSGGIDSSLVLSAATRVARLEGLDPPVAVTKVSPTLPETREDDWQRMVIDHLGLLEWIRLDVTHDNDLVGPRAQASLLRNGLTFPAAAHIHSRLNEQIRGGTLFTGEGGDEVLGPRRITPVAHWLGDQPLRHPRRGARAIRSATRRGIARDLHNALGASVWLRPAVLAAFEERVVADSVSEPLNPASGVRWLQRRRAIRVGLSTLVAAARQFDVRVIHPLHEPRFVDAVARWMSPSRAKDRSAIVAGAFGDLLPPALVHRRTKAHFRPLYFGEATRTFAAGWTGTGLDPELIDAEALRADWLSPEPTSQTALLLQAAWLATRGTTSGPRS